MFDFCQNEGHRLQSTDRLLALLAPIDIKGFRNGMLLVGAYIIMMLEKNLASRKLLKDS